MTTRRLWESHIAKLQAAGRDVVENATRAGMARREGETKYHSRATHVDGIRFASQLEADRYKELKLLRQSGHVAWFVRQPQFDVVPGKVRYFADFLVIWNHPPPTLFRITIEDCKGQMTDGSRIKIAAVEAAYHVRITILKRADVSH